MGFNSGFKGLILVFVQVCKTNIFIGVAAVLDCQYGDSFENLGLH